ncbi:MAG: hypothetical protein AB1458_13480, partial [Bacteroidota bacterium]
LGDFWLTGRKGIIFYTEYPNFVAEISDANYNGITAECKSIAQNRACFRTQTCLPFSHPLIPYFPIPLYPTQFGYMKIKA